MTRTGGRMRLRWLAGVLWALSWFELYLEIFRFRHVALPWGRGPGAAAMAFGPNAHAGWWLRTDLVCAVAAPVMFVVLAMVHRRDGRVGGASFSARPFFPTMTVAAAGGLIAALGLLNQLIWRPPFIVDLTLRRGNGGFVVIGVACIVVAAAVAHHRGRQIERGRPLRDVMPST